jgi:hypothetical protein
VIALVVVVIVVAVLAAGAIVADLTLRSFAESAAKTAIAEKLPKNVSGDVAVSIGGFSFLAQLLAGSFDDVTLDAPALTVDGIPVDAHVVASGVPTDLNKPVKNATATFSLSEAAVNSIVKIPGAGAITLADGSAGYTGSADLFGFSIGYTVAATASVAPGNTIVFTPTKVELSSGSSTLDVGQLLSGIQNTQIPVCVADRLPQSITVTGIQLAPGSATVDVTGSDIPLTADGIRTVGSCP